jgi:hypothetical protein
LVTLEGHAQKVEYPPLLPHGFHARELSSLMEEFVNPFPESETRATLLEDFALLFRSLHKAGIVGQIWLDGSFLTTKPNPGDIDFILVIETVFFDSSSASQQALIESFSDDDTICDTNVLYVFPPEQSDNISQTDYWKSRFGSSADGTVLKGIVTLEIQEGGDSDDTTDDGSSEEDTAG